ncbi:helix-turn-helix domain-containing protein [Rhodobacteraceae bacterium R_SAG9]|nr:helix-turn-helix domain-containing protein [Rhodobacteraceae bacterium R_SAG9]
MDRKEDELYLSSAEVARLLGISLRTLGKMRRRIDGPPAVRINARVFRYRRSELDCWLSSRDHR